MAYGARALGLRSPHSSRGSDAPPGRTRESSTGRRGTGDSIRSNREVREMRNAATVLRGGKVSQDTYLSRPEQTRGNFGRRPPGGAQQQDVQGQHVAVSRTP